MDNRSDQTIIIAICKSIVVLGILSLLFLGTFTLFYSTLNSFAPRVIKLVFGNPIFLVFFIGWFFTFLYFKKKEIFHYWLVLAMLVIVFTGAKLIFVFSFSQNFYSDFLTMWNFAIEQSMSDVWLQPFSPQSQRPMASLYPLVYLFGSSVTVFKIYNVIAIILHNFILAILAKKWFSEKASILCFIILCLIPEYYFSSLIPSHDIPGGLYFVIYLFLGDKIVGYVNKKQWIRGCVSSFLLSFIGLLLDIQRSTFIFIVIGFFIFLIIRYILIDEIKLTIKNKNIMSIIFICIIPVILVASYKSNLVKNDILYDPSNKNIIYTYRSSFCNLHSMSNGTFDSCSKFYKQYGEQLDHKDKIFYKKAFVISSFYYDLPDKFINYFERQKFLAQLGTQGHFYYGKLEGKSEEQQGNFNYYFYTINAFFVFIFVSSFLGLFAFYIWSRSKGGKLKLEVFFPIIIMSIVVWGLGMFSENQPRYLYMGWGLWTLSLVGLYEGLMHQPFDEINQKYTSKLNIKIYGYAIVFFTVFFTIVYFIFKLMFVNSDYLLLDMRKFSIPECITVNTSSACPNANVDFIENTFDKKFALLQLKYPLVTANVEKVSSEMKITISPEALYTLSLYIKSVNIKAFEENRSLLINIYINDGLLKTVNANDIQEYRFIQFTDLESKKGILNIKFELVSNVHNKLVMGRKVSEPLINFKFMSVREK